MPVEKLKAYRQAVLNVFILLPVVLAACSPGFTMNCAGAGVNAPDSGLHRIARPYSLDIPVWQLSNLLRPVNYDNVVSGSNTAGTLKAQITQALRDNGFSVSLPLNFRIEQPPSLLVISPRDKISYLDRILLEPGIDIPERTQMERDIGELGYSALVVDLGGLGAAYPSLVSPELDLKQLIHAIVEEWAHQYLSLRPLGFLYLLDNIGFRQAADIIELNETLAGMMSEEIAGQVYQQYYGAAEKARDLPGDKGFDFAAEMRKTRIEVDRLLGQGKLDVAEGYMEERRLVFNQQGYRIRKMNQAYFAFHGIYGQDPGSISPVYSDLRKLRQSYTSLSDFIRDVSGMTGYEQLRAAAR